MTQNKKWKWSRTVKTKYCRTLMEKDTKLDWEEQEWLFLLEIKKNHYYYLHLIEDTSLGTLVDHQLYPDHT